MSSRLLSRCAAPLLLVMLWLGAPANANAQDPTAALQRVTDLNKKAVEAYENLDMEEAAKFLRQALELCAAEGLNNHKAKARTHIHLGIVQLAGLRQRDRGIQQFKRALEIDPTIKPTKSLVNPEIQAAFDEAARDLGPGVIPEAPKPAEPVVKTPEPLPPPPVAEPAAPTRVKGVVHTPVTEARFDSTVTIKAAVEGSLGQDKIILAYRPEGATDFLARDMEKDARGWYVARIPQPATRGSVVSYYIEARNRAGVALGNNGSANEPHVISLTPHAPVDHQTGNDSPVATEVRRRPVDRVEDEPSSGGREHRFWFSLGIGSGYGWAKGTPEVNQTDKQGKAIEFPGGFAPAQLMHLAPEVGVFASPNLLVSLQGRLQVVTAATEVWDKSCPERFNAERMKGVCPPAKGAIALLGKATWLLGKPMAFRPWLSLSAGGGEIRHLISIDNLRDCGANGTTQCTDTVLGGVILVGPGAGFTYDISSSLAFVAGLNSLVGLPNPTINFDLNVGLAVGM